MNTATGNPLTLGQQHRQAFECLLEYDKRAQACAQQRQNYDQYATWFGLQIKLGEQTLLLPQQQLAEVLPPPKLTTIPGTPAWMLGLTNHHGQLLPVVDLYGFIYERAWPKPSQTRVIVTDNKPQLGFIVTEMGQSIRSLAPTAIEQANQAPTPLSRWASSQAQTNGHTYPVLDLNAITEAATHWKRN